MPLALEENIAKFELLREKENLDFEQVRLYIKAVVT